MTRFKLNKEQVNWPLKKIAARLGCSVATACKLRMKAGNIRKKVDWEKVDWHKSSTSELAKKLGKRMNAVSRERAYYAPETLVKFKRK